MKPPSLRSRAHRAVAALLGLCVAVPTPVPAAETATPPSTRGSSRELHITPVVDPSVVGAKSEVPSNVSGGPVAGAESTPNESGEPAWRTDYTAALRQAGREHKLVLLNFTGSDWCGWCVRLEKDVFSKPEFKAYAARHLVLMKVDFPRKTKLPASEAAQNAGLQQQFGVRGFPTLVAVDATGNKVAEIRGYVRGGPKAFIAALEKQTQR